jgi:antitoxin ParD1/3/4
MGQDTRHNDDDYVREAGPYADMVRELVESGRYGSTAEVMLEGLSLLRERELLRKASQDWLKAEVQKGIDSADRGELTPADEVFSEIRAKIDAMAAKQGG